MFFVSNLEIKFFVFIVLLPSLICLFYFDSLAQESKIRVKVYLDVWWHLGHEDVSFLDEYKVDTGSLMQTASNNGLLHIFEEPKSTTSCDIQSKVRFAYNDSLHVHILQGGGKQCIEFPMSQITDSSQIVDTIFGDCNGIKQSSFEIIGEKLKVCLLPKSSPRQCHYNEHSSCQVSILSGKTKKDFSVSLTIHLADYPRIWPGKSNVPSEVTEQHRLLHEIYADVLTFGSHQTVALIDAGWFKIDSSNSIENSLNMCGFRTILPSGPKLVAAFDVIDFIRNTSFQGDYFGHGSAVWKYISGNFDATECGFEESGSLGVAFNAQFLMLRVFDHTLARPSSQSHVDEASLTIREALRFVIANFRRFNITHVHISVTTTPFFPGTLEDTDTHFVNQEFSFKEELALLESIGISVSAPSGNECSEAGVAWPANLPHIVAVGALDISCTCPFELSFSCCSKTCTGHNVDITVRATSYSSGSNAYLSGYFLLLREAIQECRFNWLEYGDTLPKAILNLLQITSTTSFIDRYSFEQKIVNIFACLDFILSRCSLSSIIGSRFLGASSFRKIWSEHLPDMKMSVLK